MQQMAAHKLLSAAEERVLAKRVLPDRPTQTARSPTSSTISPSSHRTLNAFEHHWNEIAKPFDRPFTATTSPPDRAAHRARTPAPARRMMASELTTGSTLEQRLDLLKADLADRLRERGFTHDRVRVKPPERDDPPRHRQEQMQHAVTRPELGEPFARLAGHIDDD